MSPLSSDHHILYHTAVIHTLTSTHNTRHATRNQTTPYVAAAAAAALLQRNLTHTERLVLPSSLLVHAGHVRCVHSRLNYEYYAESADHLLRVGGSSRGREHVLLLLR